MSLLQRARKNIVLKFVSEALIRSLAFLFVIVAARYLGDLDYGHFSLAFFFAGLLTVFSLIGAYGISFFRFGIEYDPDS
jgi:O-antigen/teichoic acid export membrane protein